MIADVIFNAYCSMRTAYLSSGCLKYVNALRKEGKTLSPSASSGNLPFLRFQQPRKWAISRRRRSGRPHCLRPNDIRLKYAHENDPIEQALQQRSGADNTGAAD